MKIQGPNQTLSRSHWTIPVAICCVLFVFLLIAGTIILALIPVYLTPKDINADAIQNEIINMTYASDAIDGRSLTLSDMDDVSTQMFKGIRRRKNSMKMTSGEFVAATASAKKKRATSDVTMSCDQATGLFGDLFVTKTVMSYPEMCHTKDCQKRYLKQMEDTIKRKNKRTTVRMTFTNGETRDVQLAYCSSSIPVISNVTTSSNTTTSSGCTSNTSTYIYLLDQDNNFFQFNPTTYDLTFIGTINCSSTDYPHSMAIQQNGKVWTLFTDGNLYTFDIKTAQCQTTSYISDQEGLILFGMNFIKDQSTNTEKLYISSDSSNTPYRLATIDINTLEVSVIGYYYTISARAELTATDDGKLFGLFEGTPYTIAQINQTNGQILSKTSQNTIQYTSDSSHFAFTSYLSNFFIFVGSYNYTDVFLYNPSSESTTKVKTISNGIVGAEVFDIC